jgi:hypothetical protein
VPSGQERETNLCARTSEVRTEHDDPGSIVRELLSTSLEAILEQFEVSATAIATFLVFDLILNDEWLVRNVDGLVEGGRYSVMRRDALCDKTEIALNDRGGSFFDCPFANVGESFTANRSLLSGLRGCPPVLPTFGELLNKRCFDFRGLWMVCENKGGREEVLSLTLKTGLSSADAVYAKVATRSAGSAMPRMTLIDRKGPRGRKERGVCRRQRQKGLFNISLFIYNFATYAHPFSHAYPSKSAWPDAESASYGCNVISLASFPANRVTYHKFVVQVF